MQYFSWKGIDKYGKMQSGTTYASSKENLKDILLKEKIALLQIKTSKANFFNKIISVGRIGPEQLIHFFQNLSFLLSSGIDLLKSLRLITNQIKTKKFKQIVSSITLQVQQGKTLSSAANQYNIFDPFMVWLIESGEKTGKLDFVLKQLAKFLSMKQNLIKNLRQAALLPEITLLFSILIMFIIFIFIVPQFESLFAGASQNMPTTTQYILKISHFLRFRFGATEFFALTATLLSLKLLFNTQAVKKWKDYFALKIFFIKNIVLNFNIIFFLNTLALCLKSGVSLKQALTHSKNMSPNYFFKSKISALEEYVEKGKSFATALSLIGNKYFSKNLIAAIEVGEESGNLDSILKKQSTYLQKKLQSKLHLLTTILQPSLMILVGLLITFIIYSVYLPIFNMATTF